MTLLSPTNAFQTCLLKCIILLRIYSFRFSFISWAYRWSFVMKHSEHFITALQWLFQFFWIIANLAVDVGGSKCAFREWFYIVIFMVFFILSFFLCLKDTCLRVNYIAFWLCAIKKHKTENREKCIQSDFVTKSAM